MKEKILKLFEENEAMIRNVHNDIRGPEFAKLIDDIEALSLQNGNCIAFVNSDNERVK